MTTRTNDNKDKMGNEIDKAATNNNNSNSNSNSNSSNSNSSNSNNHLVDLDEERHTIEPSDTIDSLAAVIGLSVPANGLAGERTATATSSTAKTATMKSASGSSPKRTRHRHRHRLLDHNLNVIHSSPSSEEVLVSTSMDETDPTPTTAAKNKHKNHHNSNSNWSLGEVTTAMMMLDENNSYSGFPFFHTTSTTKNNHRSKSKSSPYSSPILHHNKQQLHPQNHHQQPPPSTLPGPVEVGNELEIQEGTPADFALKANAQVKVTKVSKAARYFNAQTVKKLVPVVFKKRKKKGKPPRVPELMIKRRWSDGDLIDLDKIDEHMILGGEEDEDEDEEDENYFINQYKKEEQGGQEDVVIIQSDSIEVTDGAGAGSLFRLDSAKLSYHDFTEIPKTGLEDDPDESHIQYDSTKFDTTGGGGGGGSTVVSTATTPITLRDKHGKIRMFNKIRGTKATPNTRKEKKKSRNYVKGKVIEEEHELYTLSIAVMLGLRYAIYQTHRQLEIDKRDNQIWLDSEEFMRMQKYVFRPDGQHDTPPHKLGHTFKFKDYSPVAFAYIRRMFGINEYEFIHSVCGNANFIEFISNAKSGQFFFYSSDGKYMIKTMTNTESKFLRRILPHYFRHCAQNPNTLIPKFLGMYRVKLYHLQRNVKFIVMNSVFDTDKILSSFYDLKGSTTGRDAKPNESVKKDNDVRRMAHRNPNGGFVLPPTVRGRLRKQIVNDTTFLKEMKIMDYSMLIGVHYVPSNRTSSNDSILGLAFRGDSESVRSNAHKKQLINMKNKPSTVGTHKRVRSDGAGVATPSRSASRLGTPKKTNKSPHIHNNKSFLKSSGKKVEFLLDKDVMANELLEEKPSNSSYRPNSPFNLNEIERIMSDNSVYSASTLGFDEPEDLIPLESRLSTPGKDENVNSPLSGDGSVLDWQKERLDIDIRREAAIEQSYWPFHRYYEINGQRRVLPINDMYHVPPSNDGESGENNMSDANCSSCLGNPNKFNPDLAAARKKWQLKDFEKPISNRKDSGFVMDVTGVKLPMNVTVGNQKQECDGQIFYMGIIDILQQFNVRKRMEARYRRMKGSGWDSASCVHPDFYAERFVKFFDEYTQRRGGVSTASDPIYSADEEILFLDNQEHAK